ncbi:receptor-type protein kinase, putative [Bodo saltans]|uniref:Receptor-type protein kinase, putative n=1 Tax=Bodo saltans TaxID=75058 RepID=A0A0S4IKA3_BODSA|nr:receptor-type protein kinase, putative [Bodo saltans]|eukprot:CUE64571.1 receptor-type protein kinase, putative [Bodo saltans]
MLPPASSERQRRRVIVLFLASLTLPRCAAAANGFAFLALLSNLKSLSVVNSSRLNDTILSSCIAKLRNLTCLDLSHHGSITARGLERMLPALAPSLQRLTLSGCPNLTNDAVVHIAALEQLQYLDLSWCVKLTDLRLLAPLSALTTLLLGYEGLYVQAAVMLPQPISSPSSSLLPTTLTTLDVRGRSLPASLSSCIATSYRALRHLILRSCGFVSNDTLRDISQCNSLQSLDLRQTMCQGWMLDFSCLLSLKDCLQRLEISEWKLSHDNFTHLSQLVHLRHLSLPRCEAQIMTPFIITGTRQLTSLSHLEIFEPPMTFKVAWICFRWLRSIRLDGISTSRSFLFNNTTGGSAGDDVEEVITNAVIQAHITPAQFTRLESVTLENCRGVTPMILRDHFSTFPLLTSFVSHQCGGDGDNNARTSNCHDENNAREEADDTLCASLLPPTLSMLQHLSFQYSSTITSTMMESILRGAASSLQHLELTACPSVTFQALSPLLFLQSGGASLLTYLELDRSCDVTNSGVIHIAQQLPRLRTLALRYCTMSHVGPLVSLEDLCRLDLRWCEQIVDLHIVASALQLECLRSGVDEWDEEDMMC